MLFRSPGNIEQTKAIVREVAKEIKFIEREYGSKEFKLGNDNFVLISNNRLKSWSISTLIGGYLGSMISSPTNLGVFLEYDPTSNMTTVTVTEELLPFSLKSRRADLIKLIREKADKFDLRN